ncbi:MAG: ketoacyl-ACP synthase III [Deltaproteobacteria bacterium]|nr:ketoacyl-ACP synthase III [Candidatus Zymogenaceae bacterium]
MRRTKIISTGRYLPERVVTNAELEKFMDTTHQWILDRSGIEERRYAEFGVGPSDLGYEAAVIALERAGMEITDIDMIIFATLSPDNGFPGPGCRLNRRLEAKGIATVDVRNQCTGFVYGMSIADQFIKNGMYDHVLVVGGEVHSTGLEFADRGREVTVLFGDGAGAVILGPSEDEDRGILSTHLHADGKGFKELWVEFPASRRMPREIHQALDDGRQWPRMNGTRVFKNAVVRLPEVITEALDANGYTVEDIDHLVPHQANMRINQFVGHKMKIPNEKIWHNIQRYGNTTAATIPICLDEMIEQDKLKEGDVVVIAAFGAGYTWGSVLIRW